MAEPTAVSLEVVDGIGDRLGPQMERRPATYDGMKTGPQI